MLFGDNLTYQISFHNETVHLKPLLCVDSGGDAESVDAVANADPMVAVRSGPFLLDFYYQGSVFKITLLTKPQSSFASIISFGVQGSLCLVGHTKLYLCTIVSLNIDVFEGKLKGP